MGSKVTAQMSPERRFVEHIHFAFSKEVLPQNSEFIKRSKKLLQTFLCQLLKEETWKNTSQMEEEQ